MSHIHCTLAGLCHYCQQGLPEHVTHMFEARTAPTTIRFENGSLLCYAWLPDCITAICSDRVACVVQNNMKQSRHKPSDSLLRKKPSTATGDHLASANAGPQSDTTAKVCCWTEHAAVLHIMLHPLAAVHACQHARDKLSCSALMACMIPRFHTCKFAAQHLISELIGVSLCVADGKNAVVSQKCYFTVPQVNSFWQKPVKIC